MTQMDLSTQCVDIGPGEMGAMHDGTYGRGPAGADRNYPGKPGSKGTENIFSIFVSCLVAANNLL